MSVERVPMDDPHLMASAYELRDAILACYPEATFEISGATTRRVCTSCRPSTLTTRTMLHRSSRSASLTLQIDDELPITSSPSAR